MPTVRDHAQTILAEHDRAKHLHPTPHDATHSASLILEHAIALHQQAYGSTRPPHRAEARKLLTKIAALALRRLVDSQAEPWRSIPDPTTEA